MMKEAGMVTSVSDPTGITPKGNKYQGSYGYSNHEITLTKNALTSRSFARWVMVHEVEHYNFEMESPSNGLIGNYKKLQRYGGEHNYTRVTEGKAYNLKLALSIMYL